MTEERVKEDEVTSWGDSLRRQRAEEEPLD